MNAANQIGASLGTAVLNPIAAGATAAFVGPRAEALVQGLSNATVWAAAALVAAAVMAALLINSPPPAMRKEAPIDFALGAAQDEPNLNR